MKRKVLTGIFVLLLAAVAALSVVNFSGHETKKAKAEKGDITLYYISADGTSFYKMPYKFAKKGRTKDMAAEVLQQLGKVPAREGGQASIPSTVVWSDLSLEEKNLVVDFASGYSKLTNVQEIFLRASVVKSLVQLEGIDTVEFKQNGTPLLTLDDQPVGPMSADLFIDDSNANWGVTQDDTITLFYANKAGDRLTGEEAKITVKNNIPMEQTIIERLARGSGKEGCYSPLPKGTKVLKTVTKNGTCYVDLNENFLSPMEDVTAYVTVYAVVNSLVELANVNKVQFTINGKKVKRFRETLDFDVAFSRNLDLYDPDEEGAGYDN